MTASDPPPARPSADSESDAAEPSEPQGAAPLALVARIAESLPQLDARELDELADAVESLTDAIGLRIDWLYSPSDLERPPAPPQSGRVVG